MTVKNRLKSLKTRCAAASERVHTNASHILGRLRFCRRQPELEQQNYLFILAHPRSGSTLLTHVLSTNPDILSYGENHKCYQEPDDLKRLAYRTTGRKHDHSLQQKYIMDKLVWPKYGMPDSIHGLKNTKYISIVRKPKDTFNSMYKLLSDWRNEQKVFQLYMNSLQWLTQQVEQVNCRERFLCIFYENMLKNSQPVFDAMQSFLQVEVPFCEEYETTSETGKLRYGDSSKNIRAGKFCTPDTSSECPVSADLLNQAHTAYEDFIRLSEKYATSV